MAPYGNKHAVGNCGGRPRETDINEWVDAIEAWSKRDDATALCQFCVERDTYADKIYELRDRYPEFAGALKKAKVRLAARIRSKLHDKEGPYNYGLFMRDLPAHDQFVHDYEEGLKDQDLERKKRMIDHEIKAKSAVPQMSPEQMENLKLLNNQLTALQEAKKKK